MIGNIMNKFKAILLAALLSVIASQSFSQKMIKEQETSGGVTYSFEYPEDATPDEIDKAADRAFLKAKEAKEKANTKYLHHQTGLNLTIDTSDSPTEEEISKRLEKALDLKLSSLRPKVNGRLGDECKHIAFAIETAYYSALRRYEPEPDKIIEIAIAINEASNTFANLCKR